VAVGTATIGVYRRAVRWDPAGRATVLPLPEGADGTDGTIVVNNRGDVLGQTAYGRDTRGVRWNWFGQVTSFGPGSEAKALNRRGTVVGRLGQRATRWDRDVSVQLPSESFSSAYDVNDSGWVAGSTGMRAALWDVENRITELPALPGQNLSAALMINESGIAIGLSGRFPVRWISGEVIQLPPLPGHFSASAIAVDRAGVVVGSSRDAQGNPTAVMWR